MGAERPEALKDNNFENKLGIYYDNYMRRLLRRIGESSQGARRAQNCEELDPVWLGIM